MFRRYGLLIVCFVLLGLNILLFFSLREKATSLSMADEFLKDDYILYYTSDRRESFQIQHLIYNEELANSFNLLSKQLDALEDQLKFSGNPSENMTQRFSISPLIQSGLWGAFEDYERKFGAFLEHEIPEATRGFEKIRGDAILQFQELEKKAKASKPGKHSLPFDFQVTQENTVREELEWIKRNDSVVWTNDNKMFVNFITRLDDKISSSKTLQAKRVLDKMSAAFAVSGKVQAYGKSYDLSDISMAELAAVCKHLELLHAEFVESCVSANSDKFLFQ